MRKVLFMFGQLRDQDIDWLAKTGRTETAAPRAVLIPEAAEIDAMYILLDGRMTVNVRGIGQVAELQPGEIIGEMSFVSSLPTSASVAAVSACRLFTIDRHVLDEHLSYDAEFASRFYKSIAMYLADRLRGTVQRLGHGPLEGGATVDEADEEVLDSVYLAGLRFERLVGTLAAGR